MDLNRQNKIISYISNLLNLISLLCGLLVITTIIFINWVDRRLLDRVSLRLALAIAVTDALRAIAILINKIFQVRGALCTALAVSIPWLTLVYIFLTASIAFNLQLVVLGGKAFNRKWEPYYWGVSFFSSTAILFPPLAYDRFGYDQIYEHCTYRDSQSEATYSWKVATQIAWIIAGCLYCITVVFLTALRVNSNSLPLNLSTVSSKPEFSYDRYRYSSFEEQQELRPKLKRLVRSIAFYCMVPVVTHTGFCILTIHNYYTKEHSPIFMFWSVVGIGLPGTLNFIVFLMDPSLSAAVLILRRRGIFGGRGVNYRMKKTTSTPLYLRSSISNVLMNHQSLMPYSNTDGYHRLAAHGQLLSPGIMSKPSIPQRGKSRLREEITARDTLGPRQSNSDVEMRQSTRDSKVFKLSRPTTVKAEPPKDFSLETSSSLGFMSEDLNYSLGQVNCNEAQIVTSFNFPPPPRYPPTNSVFFSASNNHKGLAANKSSGILKPDSEGETFNLPFNLPEFISSTPNRASASSTKTSSRHGILNSIYFVFPQLKGGSSRSSASKPSTDKQYIHPEMDPNEVGALFYDESETIPYFYEDLFKGL